jgi:hypothetical protein
MLIRPFRFLSLGLLASIATLTGAATASADNLPNPLVSCAAVTLSQPFLPWADVAQYTPVPGGTFTSGTPNWALSGGAAITQGATPVDVDGPSESQPLSLPDGSSATSPAMCTSIEDPDLRFFAVNSGSLSDTLAVSVSYEDGLGNLLTTQIGGFTATGSWEPMVQDPIVVNLISLLQGGGTPIAFTFTPQGTGGHWQIDDVYVDPAGRS